MVGKQQQILAIAFALLLAEAGSACADVIVTDTAGFGAGLSTYTFTFDTPVVNADELLSISAGAVSSYESGTFTLDVEYSDSSKQQIYSSSLNENLTSIADETFTEGTITALVFSASTAATLVIPAGTEFTFATVPVSSVPEPASATLLGAGLAGLWAARRRRRSKRSGT